MTMNVKRQDLDVIEPAYRKMIEHAGYPVFEDDVEAEIQVRAAKFLAEEYEGDYHIGTANFQTLGILPYLVESARMLCCGAIGNESALKMLKLAMAELIVIVGDDSPTPRISPTSPGEALDLLIKLHLSEDDLAPGNLPTWDESDFIPGKGIGDGAIRYARGRSGRTELATAWFPEEGGNSVGWVVYVPATCTSHILSTLTELAAR